ncbi:MAG: DNA-binding protein, partial [Elusimicrobiota bacterium]
YDQNLDENNPMFDLNRDLIKEQKDITIIKEGNVSDIITKILQKKQTGRKTAFVQTNLFG